jgi:hypothetical protein
LEPVEQLRPDSAAGTIEFKAIMGLPHFVLVVAARMQIQDKSGMAANTQE